MGAGIVPRFTATMERRIWPRMEKPLQHRRIEPAPEEIGQRLDQWLAARFPAWPRNAWQERIRQQLVRVNGEAARASRRLRAGDWIEYSFHERTEPEVARNYSILFEDESLLAINKPANLPVHPSGIYQKNTLLTLLREDRGPSFEGHLVHRLDRETSGVLVLAGNASVARRLQQDFQEGAVTKLYLAIVEGQFPDELDARGWLHPDPDGPVQKKRAFHPKHHQAQAAAEMAATKAPFQRVEWAAVQSAHTHFRRRLYHAGLSLLECRLFQGRMHQIRATLQSLGYPMVGDRLYGVDPGIYLRLIEDNESEADRLRLRLGRTALHAWRLTLPHPQSGAPLPLEAPLPEDMAALFPEKDLAAALAR